MSEYTTEHVLSFLDERAAWIDSEMRSGGNLEHLRLRYEECRYIAACIRDTRDRLATPSTEPPLSEEALTKLGQAMLADYPETDYLPSRGEIAMHAMQGLLAESSDAWPAEAAARNAVMYADALLAELSKPTGLE